MKYTCFELFIFQCNGSVAVEAGFVWAFQYITQFESWFSDFLVVNFTNWLFQNGNCKVKRRCVK